jgi:hypothetical protein
LCGGGYVAGPLYELGDWCTKYYIAIERQREKIPEIIKAAVAKRISRDEAEAEISTALEEYILAAAKFEARVTFIFRRAVSTADGSVGRLFNTWWQNYTANPAVSDRHSRGQAEAAARND